MKYPVIFALLSALFWGLYGPSLGQARSALLSPFKPYVAVGVAWGAFTLTLAMFSGGAAMPHLVMPIVFGGAVTITALVSVWSLRGEVQTSPWLWVGVVGMFVCIVLVASNTPHAAPKPPAAAQTTADAGTDLKP